MSQGIGSPTEVIKATVRRLVDAPHRQDAATAAACFASAGTNLGRAADLPVLGGLMHDGRPTGRRVSVVNIHIYRMRDGLIATHSAARDDLGMMQQLGLLPETRHAAGDMSRPAR